MTGTPIIKWIEALREAQRPRTCYLWGQPSRVTPVLISEIFGDGGQLIGLSPIMDRPRYYLVRIDNRWNISNFAHCPEELQLYEHLDEIYSAIEDQFGRRCEDWEHNNGRTYTRHNPWPAANVDDGCSWWTEEHFMDLRTDKDE